MADERSDLSGHRSNRIRRRTVLQTTAGLGLGSMSGVVSANTDKWGDSCDDAPVVDGTGNYDGTLESPDDTDYFKIQLDHGEYLDVDVFAPTDADHPQVGIIGEDYTLRKGSNVDLGFDEIELEPGIEGSFELWAEEDTVLCFWVSDLGDGGGFPYDWTFGSELLISGVPDESWGDSCNDAPVIDPTGQYSGTLVSPDDIHFFKFLLDKGDSLDVEVFAPTDADHPQIGILGEDYTLRNGSNVDLGHDEIELDPGKKGSFEFLAEDDSSFCFWVSDLGDGGGFPYDWLIAFNDDLTKPPTTGTITGNLSFTDNLLAEPLTNPVSINVSATGTDAQGSVEKVIDATVDTSPVGYTLGDLTEGNYEVTADVISVAGDSTRDDEVSTYADDGPYESVTVIVGETATGYDFTLEKTVADLPTIVGNSPVQDLDGDGLYEDINGDGEFDIVDVQALYVNLESDGIQQHADLFDFNGDGEVNLNDVQALYAML